MSATSLFVICLVSLTAVYDLLAQTTTAPQAARVYNGPKDFMACRKILNKPGMGCQAHADYPNTIQCALRKTCISFKQFKDGKCDCCGPDKDCNACDDHSDEDRVAPPGDPKVCGHLPEQFNKSLTFQCAIRRDICIDRISQWNNGYCDCCPEVNGQCCHPDCIDHSDEECVSSDWDSKFSCDSKCVAISKFNDNENDCAYDCVEGHDSVRASCEANRMQTVNASVVAFCQSLIEKNEPFYRCPSGDNRCVTLENIRDGKSDCPNGEDEDVTKHTNCTVAMQASRCLNTTSAVECIAVSKGENVDCRCRDGNTVRNCNNNNQSGRKKLF